MSDYKEIFWDVGCFNRGNLIGAKDFLEKVTQIINDEVAEVSARVISSHKGYHIDLRRKKNGVRIYVFLYNKLFMLSYDGTDAISSDFTVKLTNILQERVSKAYTQYCSVFPSPENKETYNKIRNIIEGI